MKGAIVGFGQAAEKAHVPAWKESRDFQIVAVADESEGRLALAAEYFPGVHAYRSLEELFRGESRLDFVDIATPPGLHAKQVVLSLQHRCHVLCEKPLALVLKNFETLRAQARAQDRVVFCVHNWKYAPILVQAAQLVHSGALGTLRHVELHTLRDRPAANAGDGAWRMDPQMSGGGILVDHGWHCFYLLEHLLRAEPRSVAARLGPKLGPVEEEASCTLEYPEATAVLYLTWRAPSRSNWGILYGDRGAAEIRDDALLLTRREGPPQRFEFAQGLSAGSAHPDWFMAMLEDFKTEIARPKLRGQNLREAGVCLTILTHLYQSHRLGGKTLPLPIAAAPRAGGVAA